MHYIYRETHTNAHTGHTINYFQAALPIYVGKEFITGTLPLPVFCRWKGPH